MNPAPAEPLHLLVVARHTFSIADAGLEDLDGVASVQVAHRPGAVTEALADTGAEVILIDTGFTDGRGFDAIAAVVAHDPDVAVLALTPDPPTHEAVARATRVGARGFVDVDAAPDEFAQALQAVHAGDVWFPPEESRDLFAGLGDELDVTSQERRSRLFGLIFGLVPLMGAMAAILSLAWRRYLGQIGVRPVDLAVDPTSRVIDLLANVLLLLGVLGPLLFVSSWLALLRNSPADRGPLAWLLRRPRLAWLALASLVLAISLALAVGPDLFQRLVVGPVVALALLARVMDLDDELPEFLQLRELNLRRAMVGGVVALIAFFGILIYESQTGPDLRADGAHGWLAPKLLGFKAQPVRAFNLDPGGPPRDLLYLGGNADLYVLVDPCNDDNVELVSVGRHRLEVIDEVSCDPGP